MINDCIAKTYCPRILRPSIIGTGTGHYRVRYGFVCFCPVILATQSFITTQFLYYNYLPPNITITIITTFYNILISNY